MREYQTASRSIVVTLLPFALILAICLQTLSYEFTLDDSARLLDNPKIIDSSYYSILTTANWPGDLYRPVQTFVNKVIYQSFGFNPAVYHLLSVVLYFTSIFFCYLFLKGMKLSRFVVWVTTLLFAAHPLHTEVIANISYQSEILSALFILFTLYSIGFLFSSSKSHTKVFSAAILVFFSSLLAILSKESGLTLLLLCPMVVFFRYRDTACFKRNCIFLAGSLFLAFSVFVCLRVNALGSLNPHKKVTTHDNALHMLSDFQRVTNVPWLTGMYLGRSALPLHISAVSSFPKYVPARDVWHFSKNKVLYSLLSFLFVGLLFAPDSVMRFGVCWFFLSFAVTANLFFPIGTIYADRLAFLPLLGVLIAIVSLINKLPQKSANILFSILIVFFLLKLNYQLSFWQSNRILFTYETSNSPRSAFAFFNLGLFEFQDGDYKAAINSLNHSHLLYPKITTTVKLLAIASYRRKDYTAAKHWLKLHPNSKSVPELRELGAKLSEQQRLPEGSGALLQRSNKISLLERKGRIWSPPTA